MKRDHSTRTASRSAARHAANRPRELDPRRLAAIRGASALGIAVEVVSPPPGIMQIQHSETLIRRPTRRGRRAP